MASSLIHICVAKEINKFLKRNEKNLLIGTIAPDISKYLGQTKEKSHFSNNINEDIPNIEKFLNKYQDNLNNDFVMGYYIHLYTDYLWFKYFITNFTKQDCIYTLDNRKLFLNEDDKLKYIYNDYTNLNGQLIDEYNIELSMFYEELPPIENIIKEIPMDKINLIVDNAGIIIKNAKESKAYIFDLNIINKFIEFAVSDILSKIEKV